MKQHKFEIIITTDNEHHDTVDELEIRISEALEVEFLTEYVTIGINPAGVLVNDSTDRHYKDSNS